MKKILFIVVVILVVTGIVFAIPSLVSRAHAVTGDIQVSATVAPLISQFELALDSSSSTSPLAQDTAVPFTITYGSNAATSSPLTIQASWDKGTLENDSQT